MIGVLSAIVVTLSLYQTVWGVHPIQKRNLDLALEQRSCLQTEFNRINSDTSCTVVQEGLTELYNAENVVEAIGTRLDLFTTFCQPACGQAIINAWGKCNLYDDVRSVAELLINMCSANGQRKCYQDYTQLFAAFANIGSTCSADLDAGWCSTNCRTALMQDTKTYGCCVNVPIKYIDAIDTSENIDAQANTLFTECRVPRPSACPAPANALGPPGTPLPGSQSAVLQLLNSLVAFVMQF